MIILRDSIFFYRKNVQSFNKVCIFAPRLHFILLKNRKKRIRRQHFTMVYVAEEN